MGSLKKAYINKYGEKEGLKKWKELCPKFGLKKDMFIEKHGKEKFDKMIKLRCTTLKDCINKYGEEKGIEFWNNKNKKSIEKRKKTNGWVHQDLSFFQNKYGMNDGYVRWNNRHNKLLTATTKSVLIKKYGEDVFIKNHCQSNKQWIKKYGEILGKEKIEQRRKKIQYKNSEQYYIDKYGIKLGTYKFKEYTINRIIRSQRFLKNCISIISQDLFIKLYDKLDENNKNNCYFHNLNKEYFFYIGHDKIKIAFVDFKLYDKIIEFDGDYWHSLYHVKFRDRIVDEFLYNKGYKILRIKESEYKQNEIDTINKCINFLNGNNNETTHT